jgi:hypothetical protein
VRAPVRVCAPVRGCAHRHALARAPCPAGRSELASPGRPNGARRPRDVRTAGKGPSVPVACRSARPTTDWPFGALRGWQGPFWGRAVGAGVALLSRAPGVQGTGAGVRARSRACGRGCACSRAGGRGPGATRARDPSGPCAPCSRVHGAIGSRVRAPAGAGVRVRPCVRSRCRPVAPGTGPCVPGARRGSVRTFSRLYPTLSRVKVSDTLSDPGKTPCLTP